MWIDSKEDKTKGKGWREPGWVTHSTCPGGCGGNLNACLAIQWFALARRWAIKFVFLPFSSFSWSLAWLVSRT